MPLGTCLITASQCISESNWHQSPSASPKSINHCLKVNPWIHSIAALKSIMFNHSLPADGWVHSILASKYIFKVTSSQSEGASPISMYHGFQMQFWIHSTSTFKWIPTVPWSHPPSASTGSHGYGLWLNHGTHSTTATQCISEVTRCWPPIAASNSVNHSLRVDLSVHLINSFSWTSNSSEPPSAASPDMPSVDGLLYRYLSAKIRIQPKYLSYKIVEW